MPAIRFSHILSMVLSGALAAALLVPWPVEQAGLPVSTEPGKATPQPQQTVAQAPISPAAVTLPPPPPRPAALHEPETPASPVARQVPAAPPPVARPRPLTIDPLPPPTPHPPLAADPAPTPGTVIVDVSHHSADAKAGGTLLRLLEHGNGPTIEIAWPDDAGARRQLHRVLLRCFGLQQALMTPDGHLWTDQGSTGHPWQPDRDRYSGFVRQPSGFTATAERQTAAQIRRRHGLGSEAVIVRMFPRRVDAALLGGLQRLDAGLFTGAGHIGGQYRLGAAGLQIVDLHADSVPIPGAIHLGGC